MKHQERLAMAQACVNASSESAARGKFRQRYHFMAPSGWINDPNGCIFFNGKYHLFYQHNPFEAKWGSMHWGHATSADLVHWEHLPIALAPSEPYDDHPQGGVFSGSCVDDNGVLKALYTGTANHGEGFVQTQCLAESRNGGLTFEKYAGNPVIRELPNGASSDFRDPKVLRHGEFWYMILGSSLEGGAWMGGDGCAQMYRSCDLRDWSYQGVIARSGGKLGTMWECPDLFPLGDKWVMTFSPMFSGDSKAVYLVGDMDFENARFTWNALGELDWGCEYYAAQSLNDGTRTVLNAWQNGWDWMPWWIGHGPTEEEGWCGCMALPRTVTLDSGNRLVSQPVRELEQLRGNHARLENISLGSDKMRLPCADPVCFEMLLRVDLSRTSAKSLRMDLRAGGGNATVVTVDLVDRALIFDRTNADEYYNNVQRCNMELAGSTMELRLFSDVSSIEIFADGGRTNQSNRIYPTCLQQENYLSAQDGTVWIDAVDLWAMGGTEAK